MEFSKAINHGNTRMDASHFHSTYEIYYLQKGYCDYFIENKLYHVEAGDVVLIHKHLLHKTHYPKAMNTKRLLVNFDDKYIATQHSEDIQWLLACFKRDNPIIRFHHQDNKHKLMQLFSELVILSTRQPDGYRFQLETCFHQLLILISQGHNDDYISPKQPSDMEKKMLDIAQYIHSHYINDIRLAELAKTFFISPHYLSHKFKAVTGFSITDYIHSIRIKRTQELLINTNKKIIDISQACGFGSVSQFQRVFHKYCHMTPRQFRKINSR